MKEFSNNDIVVAISGAFDPIHEGHLSCMKEARKLGSKLVIFLNTDDFLMQARGKVESPFEERKKKVEEIHYVDLVLPVIDTDQSVNKTLRKYRPNIFANGGERDGDSIPEYDTCEFSNIQMVFDVGV